MCGAWPGFINQFLRFRQWLVKDNGNEHFATIFVDYSWSAGLHLDEDCHCLVFTQSAFPFLESSLRWVRIPSKWAIFFVFLDTASQLPQDPQKEQPWPPHGLKLVIKEEVLPANDQPQFPSLELLAGDLQNLLAK